MEYISVKLLAQKMNVSVRWIQKLCESGKIDGASKLEGSGIWLIPKHNIDILDMNLNNKYNSEE